MNDLPAITLLQQQNAEPKTGQELEILGKEAASKYLKGSCSTLSEAVIETIKTAGLSPEQVKRVTEFTNVHAYLEEFKKEGMDHKVIQFDGGPADPSEILKDLNDGGGGTVFDRGLGDYSYPPPDITKKASLNEDRLGLESTKLAEAFGVEEQPIPYAEPFQEIMEVRDKLAAAYEELGTELSKLETEYLTIGDELYHQVKQASMQGMPLGHIVQGWSEVTNEPAFVKSAFQLFTPRFLEEGLFQSRDAIGASLEQIEKTAMVNTEHPLVTTFDAYCETLLKMAHTRVAQEEMAEHLDHVNGFMKMALKDAIRKGVEVAGKAWKNTTKATAGAGKVVEEALGGGVGQLAGGAIKYSPHAAAALAADEAYQRARFDPRLEPVRRAGRGVKHFTRDRLSPEDRARRQMQMAHLAGRFARY